MIGQCTRCKKTLDGEGLYFCDTCLEIKSLELVREQAESVRSQTAKDLAYERKERNPNEIGIIALESKLEVCSERVAEIDDKINALAFT